MYDLIEGEDCDFLALELIEGETLRAAGPRLSFADKLRVGEQIAAALDAAHARGVVHRDLKPDNVMLHRRRRRQGARLRPRAARPQRPQRLRRARRLKRGAPRPPNRSNTAFSFSGSPPEDPALSSHGSLIGTLRYMAPEQARGEAATTASDVYALGVVLQELITGTPAYASAPTMVAMLYNVAEAKVLAAGGPRPGPRAPAARAHRARIPRSAPTAAGAAAALHAVLDKPERRRRQRAHAIAALLLAGTRGGHRVDGARARANAAASRCRPARRTPSPSCRSSSPGRRDARLAELAPGLATMLSDSLGGAAGPARARRLARRRDGGVLGRRRTPDTAARLERELGVGVVVAVRLRPDHDGVLFDTTLIGRRPRLAHSDRRARRHSPGSSAPPTGWRQMLGHPGRLLAQGGYPDDPLAAQLFALARQRFNTQGPPSARGLPRDRDRSAAAFRPRSDALRRGPVARRRHRQGRGGMALDAGRAARRCAARVHADLLYELIWQDADRGDYAVAQSMLEQLQRLAATSDEIVPIHLDVAAYLASARADRAKSVALYRQLVDATRGRHDLYYQQVALNNLIDELFVAQRTSEARPLIAEALALAKLTGDARTGAHLHLQSARLALAEGDLERMEQECAAATGGPGEVERPLAAQVAELRLEGRVRTLGIVAALPEVDAVVNGYRQLDDRHHAAELRIHTFRRLRELGRDSDAQRQLADLLAHEGPALLAELAPDLARKSPAGAPRS